jgi:hypothetical protein
VLVIQEQWIVSAMHTAEEIDRHVQAFGRLAPFLAARQAGRPL